MSTHPTSIVSTQSRYTMRQVVLPVINHTDENRNAHMIKGVVCGYRIEEIEDEFEVYKQCRQMEKLIDELARGRKIEKILRQ